MVKLGGSGRYESRLEGDFDEGDATVRDVAPGRMTVRTNLGRRERDRREHGRRLSLVAAVLKPEVSSPDHANRACRSVCRMTPETTGYR